MKQIFLFLSLFFAFQTVTAQEVWNACNSTVNVIPAPSYDSTFVLEAPSRAALQKGMANWVPASSGGSASYLVYTALLTQSGTDAPVATVLENTLGGTVVWSYSDIGEYSATLSGAFTTNKTAVSIFENRGGGDFNAYCDFASVNAITLYTQDGASQDNDQLLKSFFEIRVYQN